MFIYAGFWGNIFIFSLANERAFDDVYHIRSHGIRETERCSRCWIWSISANAPAAEYRTYTAYGTTRPGRNPRLRSPLFRDNRRSKSKNHRGKGGETVKTACDEKNSLATGGCMVGVTGFEPAASWSQTADERFFASFLLRLGLSSALSACFPSDVSIISACYFSGYSQIWGQTANRPTSRNARWGTSLIIHSYRRLWYFRGAKSVLKITPSANTIIRIVTCFWLIQKSRPKYHVLVDSHSLGDRRRWASWTED